MSSRNNWGAVRKLPSKRFQASYIGPDGERHTASDTFVTKGEASYGAYMAIQDINYFTAKCLQTSVEEFQGCDFFEATSRACQAKYCAERGEYADETFPFNPPIKARKSGWSPNFPVA